MKQFIFTAVAALAVSTSAMAADMAPVYKGPPAPVVSSSWTGWYIGGNLGGGMASSHFDDPCFYCSSATPTRGFFTGGGQIGYNYQFGSGLFGIEADVNGNGNFKNSVIGGDDSDAMTVGIKANVSGTIRARAGLVMNNTLMYVTGGAAWADIKQTGIEFDNRGGGNQGDPTGITANASGVVWGGVIGAGVEFAMSRNWTLGAEFLHTVYRDRDAFIRDDDGANSCFRPAANCVVRGQLTTDVGRIKLNYKISP